MYDPRIKNINEVVFTMIKSIEAVLAKNKPAINAMHRHLFLTTVSNAGLNAVRIIKSCKYQKVKK